MATFQLAGMPDMRVANANAPGANVPAPVRYDRENMGLTLLQGLNGVANINRQAGQQQALQQYQQAFGSALANNDRDGMQQLYAQNPQFFEQTRQGLGLVDKDRNKQIGDAAMDLRLASQQGPEAMQAALRKNASALGYLGTSPEAVYDSWQKSPEQFDKVADLLHLHATGPEEYFKVRDQQANRQIQQGQLAETVRNNSMTDDRGRAGLNQAAQFHADDMQLKKLSYQQQQLENQYKAADNDLKRQAAQQKIDANKQEIEQRQTQVTAAKNDLYQAQQLAQELADDPDLDRIVGTVNTRENGWLAGTVRNSSADKISKIKQLQGLIGSERLKAFKGSTSNKELDAAYQLGTGLRITDNGVIGSPDTVRKQLRFLARKAGGALNGYIPAYEENASAAGGQQSAYSSLWGE